MMDVIRDDEPFRSYRARAMARPACQNAFDT
jgi:hypothetical protein